MIELYLNEAETPVGEEEGEEVSTTLEKTPAKTADNSDSVVKSTTGTKPATSGETTPPADVEPEVPTESVATTLDKEKSFTELTTKVGSLKQYLQELFDKASVTTRFSKTRAKGELNIVFKNLDAALAELTLNNTAEVETYINSKILPELKKMDFYRIHAVSIKKIPDREKQTTTNKKG